MFGSFAYFSYNHASKYRYCFTDASLRPIFFGLLLYQYSLTLNSNQRGVVQIRVAPKNININTNKYNYQRLSPDRFCHATTMWQQQRGRSKITSNLAPTSVRLIDKKNHSLYRHLTQFFLQVTHRRQVGRFTGKNTFNSIKLAIIRKTAYIMRHAYPTLRSSRNLFNQNATYSISNVDSSEMAEYSNPAELIPTQWWPSWMGEKAALMNHGSPKQSNMSNVLEPIELLIPIEP